MMRLVLLTGLLMMGCAQSPALLRAMDLSTVTTISLMAGSGSSTAGAALEEELKGELPQGNRFALVPSGGVADASLSIEARRWWVDERDMTPAPALQFPAYMRRVETMEATFHLVFGPNAVNETYRRSASSAPHTPDATIWNDDLNAANAVQIIAAFVDDLSLDAQGAVRPARAAPVDVPAPMVPAPTDETAPLPAP